MTVTKGEAQYGTTSHIATYSETFRHKFCLSSMESQPLRVAIFPYIPDLAGDKLAGLKRFIADEFMKVSGESIEVETDADPYDLNKLKSTYLTDDRDAYDVLELDTIILGELVKTGCLQALEGHFTVTEDVFTPSAVHSVDYSPNLKSHLYGVPTLICASFLMELADVDHTPHKPLLKDWSSFDQLKEALDQAENSGHRLLLASDFQPPGSSGLSMFYLGACIDERGTGGGSVYESIGTQIDDPEQLKEFINLEQLPGGHNTDRKVHNKYDLLTKEVTDSKHILMYAYSENMGEALQRAAEKNKCKHTVRIVSPPLDDSNKLLTYTDALVVNKSKFADQERAALIIKFVKFYTSLAFRTSFAFGRDLPSSVVYPRYVLPARKDFYTETAALHDKYYQQFRDALHHSIPAPNRDMYFKGKAFEKQLKKALGTTQTECTPLKL